MRWNWYASPRVNHCRPGDDRDTTACVAGGIAGLRYGLSGMPVAWRDLLRGRELLDPLLERLLAHRRGQD